MKDYRCHEAQKIAKASVSHLVAQAGASAGLHIPDGMIPPPTAHVLPPQVVFTPSMCLSLREALRNGLLRVQEIARLKYSLFEMGTGECKCAFVSSFTFYSAL